MWAWKIFVGRQNGFPLIAMSELQKMTLCTSAQNIVCHAPESQHIPSLVNTLSNGDIVLSQDLSICKGCRCQMYTI